MESKNEHTDPLEELDNELYNSKTVDGLSRTKVSLARRTFDAPKMWEGMETMKNQAKVISGKTSLFKKFFIFSIVFFAVALLFGFYMFFGGGNTVSTDNIVINVLGNGFTSGGDELPLDIEINNKNNVPLVYTDLLIEYPRGDSSDQTASDVERKQIDVGTIGAQATKSEHLAVTLFGQEGSTKDIKVTLEYRVQGSNAIYRKEQKYTVNINSAPVALLVDAPDTINANQSFSFKINVLSNAKKVVPNMLVRLDYPSGFKFESAEPSPTYLSSLWNLGDIQPGETKTITVKGSVAAENGEERSFHIYTGPSSDIDRNTLGIIFNSYLYTVALEKPFLEAKLLVNGDSAAEVAASSKQAVNVEIDWANNLTTPIRDAEIKVHLSGDVLDKGSISTQQGFYNSVDNTIVWNKDTMGRFAGLNPGDAGTVGFSFKSLSLLKSDRTIFENPKVTIEVSIKGKQPAEGDLVKNVDNFESAVVKYSTDFQIAGQALRLSGPFGNTGPIPPKVGQKTTYTILWTATNSVNSVSGAVARASLPTYVHFIGTPSPSRENLGIDPATGEIVWKIGTLEKGTGFTSPARQVYFQVEFLPSLSQVNSIPTLVQPIRATGVDNFTTKSIDANWGAVNTATLNDSGYMQGSEKVVE